MPKRWPLYVAALVVVIAGIAGVAALNQPADRTPCQAAEEIIDRFRDKPPSQIGHMESNGNGYSSMLRNLITGRYEDVDGVASPELAGHLRTVADDLATAEAAPPNEFTTGETGQHIDALLASCR